MIDHGPKSTLLNRRTVSWALYDFSNSSYILLVPAVGYAVYYRNIVAGGGPAADARWAALVAAAVGVAGILAPLVGAVADIAKLRHRMFIITTVLCCAATGSLVFVGRGDVFCGTILFFGAHVFYGLAIGLYDSYIRDLVDSRRSARLSGAAWGLGYLGGILCFAICYPLLKGGVGEENLAAYRLVFGVTAIFYLVFSLPAFLFLRQGHREERRGDSAGTVMRAAYLEVWRTLRSWRANKPVFVFLCGLYFINDAITTVIYFTAIFLEANFGMSVLRILGLTLVVQAIGIPATVVFGIVGDRYGKRSAVFGTLAVWVLVVLLMVLGHASYVPYIMSGLMGLVLGSTQSLLRAWYSEMIPLQRTAEFFGFNNLAGRVSSVLGPVAFGLLTAISGSQRVGLLSLLFFFLVGAAILLTVPDQRHGAESTVAG